MPQYERAIYFFPSKYFQERDIFLNEIREINSKAFGKKNVDVYYLTFKSLSEKEKQDKNLDIITGVEFIDQEYHTFIIEGLAEKAIKKYFI